MVSNSYHHGDLKNALIKVGVELLTKEGISGLSLRKVAKKAGVSHSAPYAHFSDKQALIAAISTEGHTQIYEKIIAIIEKYPDDPLRQLVETACAYLNFGMDEPDLFRITFSGVVEQEKDYPALVEITQKNFSLIKDIVIRCREIGIFKQEPDDLLAQGLWSAIHGVVSLVQQGQVSSSVLNQYTPRDLIFFTLNQMTQIEIDPQDLKRND
jgi:AcrR family transcriptional regulator